MRRLAGVGHVSAAAIRVGVLVAKWDCTEDAVDDFALARTRWHTRKGARENARNEREDRKTGPDPTLVAQHRHRRKLLAAEHVRQSAMLRADRPGCWSRNPASPFGNTTPIGCPAR
jgi:hypothetical protein